MSSRSGCRMPLESSTIRSLGSAPAFTRRRSAAMLAAPAPKRTILAPLSLRPVSSRALKSAASVTPGGSLLVVVPDGYLHLRPEAFEDVEALWGLDVFEVDPADGRLRAPSRIR